MFYPENRNHFKSIILYIQPDQTCIMHLIIYILDLLTVFYVCSHASPTMIYHRTVLAHLERRSAHPKASAIVGSVPIAVGGELHSPPASSKSLAPKPTPTYTFTSCPSPSIPYTNDLPWTDAATVCHMDPKLVPYPAGPPEAGLQCICYWLGLSLAACVNQGGSDGHYYNCSPCAYNNLSALMNEMMCS